jgi:hypothetical protein
MDEWYLLLSPLLLLVLVGLLSFIGCFDFDYLRARVRAVELRLFHPVELKIQEVWFRIKTDPAAMLVQTVVMRLGNSGQTVTDFNLVDGSGPRLGPDEAKADGSGEFGVFVNDAPRGYWQVWCDAYGAINKGSPAYTYFDESKPIEHLVNPVQGDTLERFIFRLNAASKRVEIDAGVPISSQAIVPVSLKYTGGDTAIVRVDFLIELDMKPAVTLTLRSSKMVDDKTGFVGHTIPDTTVITNDVKNAPSEWAATIGNAPAGKWVVSCKAYRSGAGATEVVRFDVGTKSSPTAVAAGNTVPFNFTVSGGKTVSVP